MQVEFGPRGDLTTRPDNSQELSFNSTLRRRFEVIKGQTSNYMQDNRLRLAMGGVALAIFASAFFLNP